MVTYFRLPFTIHQNRNLYSVPANTYARYTFSAAMIYEENAHKVSFHFVRHAKEFALTCPKHVYTGAHAHIYGYIEKKYSLW